MHAAVEREKERERGGVRGPPGGGGGGGGVTGPVCMDIQGAGGAMGEKGERHALYVRKQNL